MTSKTCFERVCRVERKEFGEFVINLDVAIFVITCDMFENNGLADLSACDLNRRICNKSASDE